MKTVDDVINRMYNWKMESAYNYATEVPNFPAQALVKLKKMASQFGNCGYQDGKAFDVLRKTNDQVAEILGYEWDDDNDKWIKREEN